MAAVTAGEREVAAELRPAMIENRAVVATGSVADGAGEPTLAHASGADEGEIVVGVDPFACRELLEERAVEPPGGAIVDVFDAGLLAELRRAQPRLQALVPAPRRLPVEEQGEPVGVGEVPASSASASSAKALAIPWRPRA